MKRSEAMRFIAEEGLRSLSDSERTQIIDRWADEEPSISEPDALILDAITYRLRHASNQYLASKLRSLNHDAEVVGDEPELVPCPCCSFRTLERRGEYDVCPVCFWEDDGGDDPEHYSGPNHRTLDEGRQNFITFGACSEQDRKSVDPEGRSKYRR
jgi:hypothetical protein